MDKEYIIKFKIGIEINNKSIFFGFLNGNYQND